MKRFLALILACVCGHAVALSPALSSAQLLALRAACVADVATCNPALVAGNDQAIANWFNGAAVPAWTVWKTNVGVSAVGDNIVGSELAGLSTLNTTRLQAIIMLSPLGVNPSLSDRRAFFDDVFSGAGGTATRAKLLILWKRTATVAEKLLSTGTGSDAVPATLGPEGSMSVQEASLVRVAN